MKKLLLANTSRYPTEQVRWLATFAYDYVRSEAVRCGWVDRFDRMPVALRVTNCCHAYRGLFQHVSWLHRIAGFNRRADLVFDVNARIQVWDALVRIGAPQRFPTKSTYARYKDMPDARLNDWQEAVVGLCAHEMSHIQFDYAAGDRKGDEMNAEWTEIDCVEAFRKRRAEFDQFVQKQVVKVEQKQRAFAAKRSPEALAQTALKDAVAKVEFWSRRAKLSANKLKHYQKVLKRAQQRAEKISRQDTEPAGQSRSAGGQTGAQQPGVAAEQPATTTETI